MRHYLRAGIISKTCVRYKVCISCGPGDNRPDEVLTNAWRMSEEGLKKAGGLKKARRRSEEGLKKAWRRPEERGGWGPDGDLTKAWRRPQGRGYLVDHIVNHVRDNAEICREMHAGYPRTNWDVGMRPRCSGTRTRQRPAPITLFTTGTFIWIQMSHAWRLGTDHSRV